MLPASELILHPDNSVYHLGLRPEDIADTILVVGDPERVAKITQYFDVVELRINRREFVTHTGRLGSKRLTVISSGIGTDNVEILLTELDALVNIDLLKREVKTEKKRLQIIRIGTSGSLQTDIPVDSCVASASAIGLDTLMCFYQLLQTESQQVLTQTLQGQLGLPFQPYCVSGSAALKAHYGYDMFEGNTVTCPGFYAPQGREIRLALKIPQLVNILRTFRYEGYRLTNFEMETAGYYALCQLLGHDMISLNAIVANRITNQFSTDTD
ncbi:MAG: nucleoside phosphorylase, partial [Bacteroidota bacterium]